MAIAANHLDQYHVFLASPGDVSMERERVRVFFRRYNIQTAHLWNARFEVVDVENYATTGVGRPQQLITKVTLDRYKDSLALVIGVMAQRFGSPTGVAESGTEEEFNWAVKSHKRRGYPEVKWFFKRIEALQVSSDPVMARQEIDQWERVLQFRARMQDLGDPIFYTTYADLEDFSRVLDRDLSLWLADPERPWVEKTIKRRIPIGRGGRRTFRKGRETSRTDMELLVEKLDVCQESDGEIDLCDYHCDRFEVQLYEQPSRDGEQDLAEDQVLLQPSSALVRLFEQMQMKTEIAGHWGLMKTHRDWIKNRLRSAARRRSVEKTGALQIFQAGIASHVHYFANVRLIQSVLAAQAGQEGGIGGVHLTTYDICVGPIAAVKQLLVLVPALSEAARTRPSPPEYLSDFVCSGNLVKLYPSFREIFRDARLLSDTLDHTLKVRDLCDTGALSDIEEPIDVVIAHQLFTFWHTQEEVRLRAFLRNVITAAAPDAVVLLGFTPGRAPGRLSLAEYESIFHEEGLITRQRIMTWDVYDLDFSTRREFLRERRPLVVKKEFVLFWLELQGSKA